MNGEVNKTVAILQAKQIAKTYGNKQTEQEVLKDIDLSIGSGRVCSYHGAIGIRQDNVIKRVKFN